MIVMKLEAQVSWSESMSLTIMRAKVRLHSVFQSWMFMLYIGYNQGKYNLKKEELLNNQEYVLLDMPDMHVPKALRIISFLNQLFECL